MPYELPPDPSTARRTRLTRWVTFGFAALLVAAVAYFAYLGYEGSRQLTDAPAPTNDCRTPATFGWAYEPINYDAAGDTPLQDEADPTDCVGRGTTAGDALTSFDDVPLAGWYIPAGNGADPAAATVVLAHGWSSNKSQLLDRAAMLHDTYNLVLFDFRNHGQSGETATTQGVREARDLRAVLDWLEASKAPADVAVLGVSMGGASALLEAAGDPRVAALVVESTHATLANAVQARLERSGYPLAMPGSWAVLLGTLLRTGEDASTADPAQAIASLDERPVLLVYGGADDAIADDDGETLRAAADEAGSPVELQICPDAGHAESAEVCAEAYRGWVLGFLDRVLGTGG
jgi:pimeloyl-ACP methyl ester carboxylesterase